MRAAAASALRADGEPLDLVMYCAGHYREMRADTFDLAEVQKHWRVNFEGALYVLDALLPVLRRQGAGHISVVSSVAGFRGLPKSLAYGPAKAALTHLAETLRDGDILGISGGKNWHFSHSFRHQKT